MLALAGVVFIGGAVGIVADQQLMTEGAVIREAVITHIDEGWCTYEWSGEPSPVGDDPGDACAGDAEVGEYATVLVTPDGLVWSSEQSLRGFTWILMALLGLPVMCLVWVGLWLRRRIGQPHGKRVTEPWTPGDPVRPS